MVWRSEVEVEIFWNGIENLTRVNRAFSLSEFITNMVYTKSFAADETWSEIIVISEEGRSLLAKQPEVWERFPKAELHLAVLGKFFHQDLLIDCDKSDLDQAEYVLNLSLQTRSTQLPYVFGRQLYDKFNDEFSTNRTNHLEPDDVARLLEGTPIGVCQIGSLLSGPLGLLHSREVRWNPPSSRAPLWHCSDTGCNALHFVQLQTPQITLLDAFEQLSKAAFRNQGAPSEWKLPLLRRILRESPQQEISYSNMLAFLGGCVVDRDRTELIASALRGENREELRQILGRSSGGANKVKGSPTDIASRLSSTEQLQLLAVLRNSELVDLIDRAVFEQRIIIQPEEIRRAPISPRRISRRDFRTELSILGIRSARPRPLVRLRFSIQKAYEANQILDDLEWRIRKRDDASIEDALADYLATKGLRAAVSDLIVPERSVFRAIAQSVDLRSMGDTEDPELCDRLLWKLGFNSPRYAGAIKLLKRRIDELSEALLAVTSVESESDRERIRSSGVNLFVSVEDFLERLVAYNAWLCVSDHFLVTRFQYTRADTLTAVTKVLGSLIESGNARIAWSVNGENTLGVLEAYLHALNKWIEARLTFDRMQIRRPQADLPHYVAEPDQVFPFRHTESWADFDQSEFRRYAGQIKQIADLIAKSNLSNIRNGIDHNRRGDQFPTLDSMLALIARLRQSIDLADIHRLIPKRFWLDEATTDRYGRGALVLKDYAGRSVRVSLPIAINRIPQIGFETPIVLAPGNLLGQAHPPLIFVVRSSGEFSRYWAGYPRRRMIPPPDQMARNEDSEGLEEAMSSDEKIIEE